MPGYALADWMKSIGGKFNASDYNVVDDGKLTPASSTDTRSTDWRATYQIAVDFAAYFMDAGITDFHVRCDVSKVDRDEWDRLYKWSADQGHLLSDEDKAHLFDVLITHGRPNRKGSTARRNALLKLASAILVKDYGLTKTRNQIYHGERPYTSAASILAQVKGMPTEGQISNILNKPTE